MVIKIFVQLNLHHSIMLHSKPLIIALLLFSLSASFTACTSESQSKSNSEDEAVTSIPVEASDAIRGEISALYNSTATLEAEQESNVVTKVRGIVNEIYVEEGDFVKAGQTLAKLEDKQLEIEAKRAHSVYEKSLNDFKRSQELFEKKLISAENFDNVKFEYQNQKAAYELTKLNLDNTTIKSPIDGVVSSRFIKKGNLINANDQLFHITNVSRLLAILHVPEHETVKIKSDQTTLLKIDALKEHVINGRVERISPVVNPETGTFKVTIAVTDKSGMLKPGMFTRVQIVYDTKENAILVPKSAILEKNQGESVFVIKDSVAYKKKIKTGYSNGDNIEITEGLSEGEIVVTAGQNSLTDSSLVEIIPVNI